MNNSKANIQRAKHQLSALGEITSRSQFGGYSLAVEKVVFALVSEGDLYLRACEQVRPYLAEREMVPLKFEKRGLPVSLEYYRVDEPLWAEPEQLVALSKMCLLGAKEQRDAQLQNRRLKDLPNLSVRMEVQLRYVGITSVKMLVEEGAKSCWLKLRAFNQQLSINVLFALQGAISGKHHEALPREIKQELREWHNQTVLRQSVVKK